MCDGELLKVWGMVCCESFRNAAGIAELEDGSSKECPTSVFRTGRATRISSPDLIVRFG